MVQGAWTQLGAVQSIDQFDPEGPALKGNKQSPMKELTLKDQGATLDGLIIWSDNMLL